MSTPNVFYLDLSESLNSPDIARYILSFKHMGLGLFRGSGADLGNFLEKKIYSL